jgi:hypothetical protein
VTRLETPTQGEQTRRAYGAVLCFLLTAVVVSITFGTIRPWSTLAGGLQGLALFVALQVSGARRLLLMQMMALILVASVLATQVTLPEHPIARVVVPLLWSLVVLGTIGAIGRHLGTFARINMQSILGLLAIYVLLGLLFSWIFMLTTHMGCPFFTSGAEDLGSYVYFSYVNLATVGFGDLTPQPGPPRALAVAEAIVGQLYLVSAVAIAVSRFGEQSPRA